MKREESVSKSTRFVVFDAAARAKNSKRVAVEAAAVVGKSGRTTSSPAPTTKNDRCAKTSLASPANSSVDHGGTAVPAAGADNDDDNRARVNETDSGTRKPSRAFSNYDRKSVRPTVFVRIALNATVHTPTSL